MFLPVSGLFAHHRSLIIQSNKTEKMKLIRTGILSVSLMALVVAASAAPRSGGGSFSRSSSSFSSRPSASSLYNKTSSAPKVTSSGGYSKPSAPTNTGGYTKPSQPTVPAAPKAPSSGGYQKVAAPASVPTTKPPTAFDKGNRFDSDITRRLQAEKSQASLKAYEAEKSKFKAPPMQASRETIKSNPVVKSTRVYSRVGYDDVIRRRQTRFSGWNPPVVVYQSAPSYGSWDSMFLWWALTHDSNFFYHHRNDAAVTQWHNDAMKLAQENGELKAQLASLDARVDEMEKGGVSRNEKYLPPQVEKDPVVALSKDAIEDIEVEKPTLRVATGIKDGQYSQVGNLLRRKSGEVNIELISTSGAAENLELLRSGKVDAAIVQSDVDFVVSKNSPKVSSTNAFHRATIYSEYVMLVVAKDSPIKSVSDLGKDNTVYVGPDGSGASLTWDDFVIQDARYKEVKSQHTDYASAFEKIGADKNKALLLVAGVNTPVLKEAAKTGKYRVVPVDDPDLSVIKDGEDHVIYDVLTLPDGTYPGLQTGEIKTLGVDAEWTISDAWIDKVGEEAFDKINYAVIDIVKVLHQSPTSVPTGHSGFPWMMVIIGVLVLAVLVWILFTKVNIPGTGRYGGRY